MEGAPVRSGGGGSHQAEGPFLAAQPPFGVQFFPNLASFLSDTFGFYLSLPLTTGLGISEARGSTFRASSIFAAPVTAESICSHLGGVKTGVRPLPVDEPHPSSAAVGLVQESGQRQRWKNPPK